MFDGAIHRAGGPQILEECTKLRQEQYPEGLPAGQAVTTTAGNMPSRYVIHTVGPVWHGGNRNEEKLLGNCYRNSLECAVKKRMHFNCFSSYINGSIQVSERPCGKSIVELS